MSEPTDNNWLLLLRLLASGGFTRGRLRGRGDEPVWPDSFPTRSITWEGEPFTAVQLPIDGQWLLVRPPFWQRVVQLARSLRDRSSGLLPDEPAPDPERLRRQLVANLLRSGTLTDPSVARAMLQVPRHLFLPNESVERAYADEAVITRRIGATNLSSASQPSMVAIMLEQLAVKEGMRVLEIGAGTGYNAALLAELVGPAGHVATVDIDQDIVDEARANLDAAGYGAVRTVCADGAKGFAPDAPYDRIILTVGAYDIAPVWREQLAEGGVLLLPLSLGTGEQSVAFERHGAVLRSRSAFPCGFIRLRGLMAPPELQVAGANGALVCVVAEGQDLDPAPLEAALATPPRPLPIDLPIAMESRQRWSAFAIFCAAQGDHLVHCFDRDGLFGPTGQLMAGLYAPGDGSLALLDSDENRLWAFGGDGAQVLLRERLAAFAASGLLRGQGIALEAHPARSLTAPPSGAFLLHRPQSDLVVWL